MKQHHMLVLLLSEVNALGVIKSLSSEYASPSYFSAFCPVTQCSLSAMGYNLPQVSDTPFKCIQPSLRVVGGGGNKDPTHAAKRDD